MLRSCAADAWLLLHGKGTLRWSQAQCVADPKTFHCVWINRQCPGQALGVRLRHLGHMVIRTDIKGLTDESMRALVMSKVWPGLEYLL